MSRAQTRIDRLDELVVSDVVIQRRRTELASMGRSDMHDREHPDARVAWADDVPSPDWAARCLHVADVAPAYVIQHRPWPPKAPASLSPRAIRAARDLDRVLNNYLNAPHVWREAA